ncbi:copper homeostasis periplasmic binding protein CopC [Limobrevibacterium gyesilva]|uniref:Copper homeostasis periplasmic binding protein CopC n=1 Tax=Limobrevibacterium gyesilva TaxID=2991712 RepID=A0AA41YNA3_9PROT|nr:copper homeostasis periplasmic binding protein CopC [Limobrevibacterium gyesilva]MCW3473633.1 copper homeostasis periplasmic binding protein CopC [Limobrevibacterium gyesilva]
MHRLFVQAALIAAVSLSPALISPAFAHAHLRSATPAAGSTVATAPDAVECTFSEALEPRFSALQVQDANGKRVDAGDMHLAPGDAKRMVVGVPKLGAGVYTVIWQATSVDTHRTEGRYTFTVAP